MIDAEEAEARVHRAAEEQARREEAEARARRVAEEHARREDAEVQARREMELAPAVAPEGELDAVAAVAHAAVEPPALEPAPVPGPDEPTEDLPIYAWVRRVVPAPPETADWTRALVEAKEARRDELYRA